MILHVSMMCACFCRCLSLLYCCFRADMSTVNRSLSTFCWDGPVFPPLKGCPLKFDWFDDLLEDDPELCEDFPDGDLNTAEIPNEAATAIFSSSASISSSSSLKYDNCIYNIDS